MNEFKNKVKLYFQGPKLSEDQFKKLEILQKSNKWVISLKWSSPIIAVSLILILLTLFPRQNNLQKIALEVIYNHNKNLPSEFLVNKITGLNSRLLKLGFAIKETSSIEQYSVVGGRYCSIQGSTAAQIKLRKNKEHATLYISNFSNIDKNKLPFFLSEDGVQVKVWIENNLLYAIARNIRQ